jgi:hypothetical protein
MDSYKNFVVQDGQHDPARLNEGSRPAASLFRVELKRAIATYEKKYR